MTQQSPPAESPPARPKTFDEAFKAATMTDEEAAALEAEAFDELHDQIETEAREAQKTTRALPVVAEGKAAIPDWVVFPDGFKVPPGKQVMFVLFRASWTDCPEKGDRQCILWPITDAEEKLAIKATRGEAGRTLSELTKRMLRTIDGHAVDWTGTRKDGSPDTFWREIGAKCRQQLQNLYVKTHSLSKEEQDDFFENCCVIRSSVG